MKKDAKQNINENVEKEEMEVKTPKSSKAVIMPEEIILDKNTDSTFAETCENERHGLFKLYKKTSKISTILMVVVVLVFLVSFILMTQKVAYSTPICWSIIGVTIVGLIVYFALTKNLYPNASKKYFALFWKETNNYIFNATEFSECKIVTRERYVISDVVAERVYTGVVDTASRNIVRGLYKGKGFAFGELAFYKLGQRKNSRDVIFVGRHLELQNDMHFEGRYIVNIRSDNPVDLPNDIEDLKPLIENNKFVVYGPEGTNPESVLGKTLINNLKSIDCVGSLLNVNIVFWAGRTAAYISYDDSIVAIPFEKALNPNSYEQLRKNVMDIFEILESK